MKAFHGDLRIKDKYIAQVSAHREADQIIKGKYWEKGKGCAVGCTIHSSDHYKYEVELGIPEWLARVEDRLFEGMPNEHALQWPEKFLAAIHPGADLERAKAPFIIYLMNRVLKDFDNEKYPKVTDAVKEVKRLYEIGGTTEQFITARTAAYAAYAAAVAADAAAAAYAAYAAAVAVADAAAYAAYDADAYLEISEDLLKILSKIKP